MCKQTEILSYVVAQDETIQHNRLTFKKTNKINSFYDPVGNHLDDMEIYSTF